MYIKKLIVFFCLFLLSFQLLKSVNCNKLIKNKQTISNKIICPESVTFSNSGSCLAVANRNNHTIAIFTLGKQDRLNFKPVTVLDEGENSDSILLGFSSNDKYLAVTNSNNHLLTIYEFNKQFSLVSKTILKNLFVEPISLCFSVDSKYLAVGDLYDNTVKLYNFDQNNGEITFAYKISEDISNPSSLSFSNDNKLLAISNYDNDLIKIVSFDQQEIKELISFKTYSHPHCVKFSPSGCLAVAFKSSEKADKVILYKIDIQNRQINEQLTIDTKQGIKELYDIAFSADGNFFSIAHDDMVKLYSVDSQGQVNQNNITNLSSNLPIDIDFNRKGDNLAVANLNSNEVNVFTLGLATYDEDQYLKSISTIKRSLGNKNFNAAIKPPSLNVNPGSKIKLVGIANGGVPPFIYEWRGPNKTVISGQILTIQNAKPSDHGFYTLKIIDGERNITTAKAKVIVGNLDQVQDEENEIEIHQTIQSNDIVQIINEPEVTQNINIVDNIQNKQQSQINFIKHDKIVEKQKPIVLSELKQETMLKEEPIIEKQTTIYFPDTNLINSMGNTFNEKITFDEKEFMQEINESDSSYQKETSCNSSFMYEPCSEPLESDRLNVPIHEISINDKVLVKNNELASQTTINTTFSELDGKTFDKNSLATLLDNFHNLIDNNIEIKIGTSSQTVRYGQSISFTAEATGGQEPYSYEWSGPNGFRALTKTTTIPNMSFSNVGTYTIIVTDAHNSTKTMSISLSVVNRSAISKAISRKYCKGVISRLFVVNQIEEQNEIKPDQVKNK